jgi:hypothetical protein
VKRSVLNEKAFSDALSLTLNASRSLAPRAAIGWCLLDTEDQVIACDATMAGVASTKLIHCLRQHADQCQQLLLTLEPVQGIVNGGELIKTLENSSCQKISIAHRIEPKYLDADWLRWKENWSGELHYLTQSYIAAQLAAGIESVKRHRRPWVIAVCAADWFGRSLSLQDQCDGFAMKEQLNHYASQSRAVLFTPEQQEFVSNLPDANSINEPIIPFEIYDFPAIESLLNYWASEYICNCVVYTNTHTLGYLLQQELVDEVIYYLADAGNSRLIDTYSLPATPAMNFAGWQTTSCSKAGDGCRLVLRRKSVTPAPPLNPGLN